MTGKIFGTRRRLLTGIGSTVGLATIGGGAAIWLASDRSIDRSIRTFKGHSDFVFSVALSRDGRAALSGSNDMTVKLWDVATGKVLHTFTGHSGLVGSVAFSPYVKKPGFDLRGFTPTALSASHDRTLKLWDASSGTELRTFTGNALPNSVAHTALSVAFLPDGRIALSGGAEGELKLWEVATGKELQTITVDDSVYAVALSPDGLIALSAIGGETLKLSEVTTGRELRTFRGHAAQVYSVAFSPDGRTALSGSDDMTVKLCEVATGKELRTFSGLSERVSSVAFSPDGRTALSGSFDKTLKLWDLTGL